MRVAHWIVERGVVNREVSWLCAHRNYCTAASQLTRRRDPSQFELCPRTTRLMEGGSASVTATETVAVSDSESVQVLTFSRGTALKPDANVVLLHHGISEYAERYTGIVGRLFQEVPSLDAVVAYDCRGHGEQAKGNFCRVESVVVLSEDYNVVFEHVVKKYGPLARLVLVGHSMGGLAVAAATSDSSLTVGSEAAKTQVKGILLSSPSLQIVIPGVVNKVIAPLTKVVNKVPGFCRQVKASGIPASAVTKDEDVQKAYDADPLIHPYVSFGIAEDFLYLGERICARVAADTDCRLLINCVRSLSIYGEEDSIVSSEGGARLVGALQNKALSTTVVVPGARHEVFHELKPARDMFYQEAARFLSSCFAE